MRQFLWALLLFSAIGQLALAEVIGLDAFVQQVVESNPSLKASQFNSDAQRRRILPAFALDDPFFAAGVDEVQFSDASMGLVRYQVSLGVPLPTKLVARKNIAQSRADASDAEANIQRRELVVVATQAFARACFNKKAIELNRETSKLIEDSLQSAKSRYKSGEGSHHEWLQAKIELSILNVELAKLEREKKIVQAWMNELRNQEPEAQFDIQPLLFDSKLESEEGEIEVSLEQQPELNALSARVKMQEAQKSLAASSYFPDLVLQGMVMHPYGGMEESPKWGLMAGITLPLFFFQKQIPLQKAATSELKAAQQSQRALENSLRTEVVSAKLELATARDVLKLYTRDVIPLTELAAQNARVGYASRRAPLTQLLESLRTQRIQKLELYAAHIDVELAKLRLKEILSAPPLMRFAPSRPSTLGSGGMPTMTSGSSTTGMGRGMKKMEAKEPEPETDKGTMDSMRDM